MTVSFYPKLAVIPAKASSERCPGKNLRLLGGLPLFLHSVHYAVQEGFVPVVSTDCDEVITLCRNEGITFMQELVDDSKLENCIDQVLRHFSADILAILAPTSPFRAPGLLRRIACSLETGRTHSAYTAQKIKVIGHLDGHFQIAHREQDARRFLNFFDGNIVAFRTEFYLEKGQFFTDDSANYENPFPCNLQIDTEEEYKTLVVLGDSPVFRDLLAYPPEPCSDSADKPESKAELRAPAGTADTAPPPPAKDETLTLSHPQWSDQFLLSGSRGRRAHGSDAATVLLRDASQIVLKWDRWGTETFSFLSPGHYKKLAYDFTGLREEHRQATELFINPYDGANSVFRLTSKPFISIRYSRWDFLLQLDRMERDIDACIQSLPALRSVLFAGLCKDSLSALVLALRLKKKHPRLCIGAWGCAWAENYSGSSPVYKNVTISREHARICSTPPYRDLLARYGDALSLVHKAADAGIRLHLFGFYSTNSTWQLDLLATERLKGWLQQTYVYRAPENERINEVHGKILHLGKNQPELVKAWIDEMFTLMNREPPECCFADRVWPQTAPEPVRV